MKHLQSHGSLLPAAVAISLFSVWLLSTHVACHTAPSPSPSQNRTSNPWQSFHNFAGRRKGDHVSGLAYIKQYLHEFGYISNSSNFTDSFDDTLESALKKYQQNFNLNATGVLDNTTVQRMVIPRCGNADIINGTSSMNSGKPACMTLHTVSHYSFFEGNPKWPESQYNLTYAFWPDNQLDNTTKTVFSRAFERWAAVTPLTFTETDYYLEAEIKIGFYVGDHGDGESFDGSMGTLAHSFSPTTGWFHLDNEEDWVVEGDVTKSSSTVAIDLESVAVT